MYLKLKLARVINHFRIFSMCMYNFDPWEKIHDYASLWFLKLIGCEIISSWKKTALALNTSFPAQSIVKFIPIMSACECLTGTVIIFPYTRKHRSAENSKISTSLIFSFHKFLRILGRGEKIYLALFLENSFLFL